MTQEIRDEMDSDMEDSGVAQGEIESLLNHWGNKYTIQLKASNQKELADVKADLELAKKTLADCTTKRIFEAEKYKTELADAWDEGFVKGCEYSKTRTRHNNPYKQ